MKNVLFGAGVFAPEAIKLLGKEEIAFIVDNNPEKDECNVDGVPVRLYSTVREELLDYTIIVSVSKKYENEICEQLKRDGYINYTTLGRIKSEMTCEKISRQFDEALCFERATNWIRNNSINGECIICNSDKLKGYPEVTGYYIPSLVRWGYREQAEKFANWLLSIQQEDGAWMDTDGNDPYIFDSAQILKGLLAVRDIYSGDVNKLDNAIIDGCEWILRQMTDEGRLVTPSTQCWGTDESTCSELIHLYCLSPISEAGKLYNKPEYLVSVKKIFEYYRNHYYEKIMSFSLLSHFYAYIMEALIDLGYIDMCREAMAHIANIQKESGAVPAYNNVDWVCSTGLFQLALVWFKLGDVEKGNSAFEYACRLQNDTGGWFGSYLSEDNSDEINTYFSSSEISWANKYYLDALYYKKRTETKFKSDNL